MIALQIDNVDVRFGGLQVLTMCRVSVEAGEKRAIIGPNGAGKTTLFNVISGIIKPSAGRVLSFGQDITRSPAHVRASLGLARTFQITNLFTNLSVLENILLGLQALTSTKWVFYRTASSFTELIDNAVSLLERWGLEDKKDQPVRSLSHGEQRQLEIILALASRPKILLLDEPTEGLAPLIVEKLLEIIQSLKQSGLTIILVEQDVHATRQVADRYCILQQGMLVYKSEHSEFWSKPELQETYLGV